MKGCKITAEEALAAENQRYVAQVQSDVATLDRLLAEDLVYQHSTGATDDKTRFIQAIDSGAVRYRTMECQEVKVRIFGDVAVITGRSRFEVTVNSNDGVVHIRFHSIWVKRAGAVQFVSWQATLLAKEE